MAVTLAQLGGLAPLSNYDLAPRLLQKYSLLVFDNTNTYLSLEKKNEINILKLKMFSNQIIDNSIVNNVCLYICANVRSLYIVLHYNPWINTVYRQYNIIIEFGSANIGIGFFNFKKENLNKKVSKFVYRVISLSNNTQYLTNLIFLKIFLLQNIKLLKNKCFL